jgi:hypothetical protein
MLKTNYAFGIDSDTVLYFTSECVREKYRCGRICAVLATLEGGRCR